MSEVEERPDWITCVNKGDKISWCGLRLSGLFHFVDIEHAAFNGINQGRLLTCPECIEAINKALNHETE